MQFPARNVDVYMVDMDRVEVLEGPQGTLFGGGAEAGAIRYITNKPKLDVTEGNAEASYGTTAGGDPNTSVNATLNLPLIADKLAVRAVIYNDRHGGYIDNVPSNFTRINDDIGNYYASITPGANGLCPNGQPAGTGFCVPANTAVANNYALAQQPRIRSTYQGIRVSALYQINDDWNVLIAQSYPEPGCGRHVHAVPRRLRLPAAGALQVTRSRPSTTRTSSRTRPGPSTARSAISSSSTPAATSTVTSIKPRITRTTRAPPAACTTVQRRPGGGGFGAGGSPGAGVPPGGRRRTATRRSPPGTTR